MAFIKLIGGEFNNPVYRLAQFGRNAVVFLRKLE